LVAFANLTFPLNINTVFPALPLSNFYDANGDTLSFSVSGLPTWAFFDNINRIFSGEPTVDSIITVSMIISDGWGG
jgi:hypothetical protein